MEVPFRRIHNHPEPPVAAWQSEAWFLALPAERRDEYLREHRAKHERFHELVARERRRAWIDAAQMGAAFAIADIASLNADAATTAVAFALGAVLGWISGRFAVNEVATGAVGLALFFVCGLMTRGGLSPSQLWTCFPLGLAAAWLAWRRQDRGSLG